LPNQDVVFTEGGGGRKRGRGHWPTSFTDTVEIADDYLQPMRAQHHQQEGDEV